jgi:restriction system protein
MSFLQVKNYAEEFWAAIEDKVLAPPVEPDETVAEVAEDIEETTRDFVLKTLAQELKGHPFAHFVAHVLNTMGYRTRVSPEGLDGGIDVVAHKDELGFEPPAAASNAAKLASSTRLLPHRMFSSSDGRAPYVRFGRVISPSVCEYLDFAQFPASLVNLR